MLTSHPLRTGMKNLVALAIACQAALVTATGYATPSVTAIAPALGNTAGGTPFTLSGAGFLAGATVRIGNVPCTALKVVSSSAIIGVTGVHGAGTVSVTVFNTASDSSATNSLFTYNSTIDLTRTAKADFEAAGAARTNLNTVALDSTLRWTDWTPTTGGSAAAGTYYYALTATTASGETRRSAETAGTTLSGGNNAVRLGWTAISGAIRYQIYRTTVSGSYVTPSLIATLDTTGYTDAAASPSSGAPPSSNTASGDMRLAFGTTPAATFTAGPATSSNVTRDGFSIRRPDGTFLVVHGRTTTTTSNYDPVANTMTLGPATTANVQDGAHAVKRDDGTFLIVHGNGSTTTSLYDPVANTMTAGPATSAAVNTGGHALKRPDGKFLIVHGNSKVTTTLYDGALNSMSSGPSLTATAQNGALSVRRPDGMFLVVHGSNTTTTSIYDGSANTMSVGPVLTGVAGNGAHAIQRPDGRYLIVHGSDSKTTSLYDPVSNTVSAGPATPNKVGLGGHAIQRADGTFLGIDGTDTKNTYVYDPATNTMVAGPQLPALAGAGSHSLQRPDGQYLIVLGSLSSTTELYDAGWSRTGSYVSEQVHPSDLNWWNTVSWMRDADDTLAIKLRTATSSAGLAAASWRTVANGGNINAGANETWLQVGVDYARAIPTTSLALRDVWGRWIAEFRRWPAPDVLSWTANYTPTTLSVSPSKSAIAFGGQPFNTWVAADSVDLGNNGTVNESLLGKVSTFTSGAGTWALSATANGTDQVRAQWSAASSAGPWTDIAGYDQNFTIATGVAAGGSVKVYFRIQTPTSTVLSTQYSSTLTVTAQ